MTKKKTEAVNEKSIQLVKGGIQVDVNGTVLELDHDQARELILVLAKGIGIDADEMTQVAIQTGQDAKKRFDDLWEAMTMDFSPRKFPRLNSRTLY
jgi:hypothetical protein